MDAPVVGTVAAPAEVAPAVESEAAPEVHPDVEDALVVAAPVPEAAPAVITHPVAVVEVRAGRRRGPGSPSSEQDALLLLSSDSGCS